ncbi:hypothetical protein O181_108109 [Austropuccinia psidii MF-1]|uniref:Uncharacterized protein n=1 Tax=Austropuccinia psidii MF-1 TaxID=1389203 RepID=A0A9Q3JUA1_9BASI|nr:hypothetical protein [Austropuccinia psidii MF-1]
MSSFLLDILISIQLLTSFVLFLDVVPLCALSRVSPAFVPHQQPTLVILANKHTTNAHSFSDPSNCAARGVPDQNALARTPLWSTMKAFPSGNGSQDPKQADRNASGLLALCPQVLICPPPLRHHHPMVTPLLDRRKVIIQPMKDGDCKRRLELGTIITMYFQPGVSKAKLKQNPLNIPQKDSHVTHRPCQKTPRKPTPGPSGTRWSEYLFCSKQPSFPFASSELTFPAFVEPSQYHEPPIRGQVNPLNHMWTP